jgi:hypothetical protein
MPWEMAAASTTVSFSQSVGRWAPDSDWQPYQDYLEREWRATAVGLLGLGPRALVYGVAPWILTERESADLAGLGGGFGDATLGGRYQWIDFGEFSPWPALAVLVQVTAPTGRAAEDARGTLASDTTGRGAWVPQLGLQLELARDVWFARLDLAAAVPLESQWDVTGDTRRFGPSVVSALLAGRSMANGDLVLAGSLQALSEGRVVVGGEPVPDSERFEFTLGGQAAWTLNPNWTLIADVSSGLFFNGLGQNGQGRVGGGFGVRYGWFE